jgi:pimeloyl-ACP methyl ester carboxylesterase
MNKEQGQQNNRLGDWGAVGVSIVNGFWGDYLQKRSNGLALEMGFYRAGRPLHLASDQILKAHPQPSAKLCILVHGLSCNEQVWTFARTAPTEGPRSTPVDYGTLLSAEEGYTPFYVRYNSGLPVADNGHTLAGMLHTLCESYPTPVQEIVLIGHSMGGLVVRNACHQAMLDQEEWVQKVTHVFYVGTPHDGANLERTAHGAARILATVPNSITRLVGNVIDSRSQGIKDLRESHDAVPWLPHAQHYLVSGTLTADPKHPLAAILGDGLVTAPDDNIGDIPFENICALGSIGHLQLAHDWRVYRQMVSWLRQNREE